MKRQPNILLILTDEHAPGVAGFADDEIVRTPHLDRLAQNSVRFVNASCTNPVCTPSRMCLLTGKDAHHCSAWSNHWIIFPEHVTWPQHFASHGYLTGLVGKMHFGGRDQMQGFQHRPYGDLRHGLGHQPDPLSMFPGYANAESAGVTEIPESLIQDVVVTRETLALVLEQHDRDPKRPWMVCASYGRPHSPLTAPGRYIRRYRDKVPPPPHGQEHLEHLEPFARRLVFDLTDEQTARAREAYYACVDFVDDCIGELIAGLERSGALEDTIVIYTSDHGEMLGNFGCWGKQLYFEPSMGVPLLVSLPGASGRASVRHPISLMDLFPTACGLAGLPVPEGLDGVDFSSVLRDPQTATAPRDFAPSATYRYGIRIAEGRTPDDVPSAAWRCIREQDWKYVEVEGGQCRLFDLVNDPLETQDLADHPDQIERRRKMRTKMYDGFDWEDVHRQLQEDRRRLPQFLSGIAPTTPNQYRLSDGRMFDAEKPLYDARWLPIPPGCTGGIIPQQFG